MTKEQKLESELNNYVREMMKAEDALKLAKHYFKLHAEMNASLHCADTVLHSPMYMKVATALDGIKKALKTWKRKVPVEKMSIPE